MQVSFDIATFLVGILAGWIAWLQLGKIINNQKVYAVKLVLELENRVNKYKSVLDSKNFKIKEILDKSKKNEKSLEILTQARNIAKEDYFNALDRLCFCLVKGYLPEAEWKIEYKDMIINVVEKNADMFALNSPHTNIKKVYEKLKNNWYKVLIFVI